MTVTNSGFADATGVCFCSVAAAGFSAASNTPLTALPVTTLPVTDGLVDVPFATPRSAASRPMSARVLS